MMCPMLESRSERKRSSLFSDSAKFTRIFLSKDLCGQFLDDSTILYFFEGAVGFDNTWLNVFEGVEVHAFEIIEVELLDPERCDGAVDSFKTQLLFF